MVTNSTMEGISPYVVPGIKFEYMPVFDKDSDEVRAEKIIMKISNHFKVSIDKVKSKSRKHEIMTPRHWCMWFLKQKTSLTLKEIGDIMGGRDHTTVINSIQIIREQLKWKIHNETQEQHLELIKII